jgi:geranylgeranyl reductase family protein
VFDLVVVGAGPAGSSAALAAAQAGARTLIVDRAEFPRYKTCGGGLIGVTLDALPADLDVPLKQQIFTLTFTHRGGAHTRRRSMQRVLSLVDRADLDAALLSKAVEAGAVPRLGCTVTSLREEPDGVVLTTSRGPIRARTVVGADGSASRVARHVGVSMDQVDLGLEVELDAGDQAGAWAGRVHLDWGSTPGSYAWVFPKGDVLTVGVISRKGTPTLTREYLSEFVAAQGLQNARVVRESGHLTRCRTPQSPLGKGRVLLSGDAAGLLEPWTREGISFAVRSGRLAGQAVGRFVADESRDEVGLLVQEYATEVESSLGREMRAGSLFLSAFERHPLVFYSLLTRTSLGWREFRRIARGDTTLARVMRHRPVRLAMKFLGRE